MDKYYNDKGEVGVLISGGFGAGWSTWNSEFANEMLFDADIVKLILDFQNGFKHIRFNKEIIDKIKALAKEKWPGGYFGGADTLEIEWLAPGTTFTVEEYDGSETLITSYTLEHCA